MCGIKCTFGIARICKHFDTITTLVMREKTLERLGSSNFGA